MHQAEHLVLHPGIGIWWQNKALLCADPELGMSQDPSEQQAVRSAAGDAAHPQLPVAADPGFGAASANSEAALQWSCPARACLVLLGSRSVLWSFP